MIYPKPLNRDYAAEVLEEVTRMVSDGVPVRVLAICHRTGMSNAHACQALRFLRENGAIPPSDWGSVQRAGRRSTRRIR